MRFATRLARLEDGRTAFLARILQMLVHAHGALDIGRKVLLGGPDLLGIEIRAVGFLANEFDAARPAVAPDTLALDLVSVDTDMQHEGGGNLRQFVEIQPRARF